jgi:hypothetical protein
LEDIDPMARCKPPSAHPSTFLLYRLAFPPSTFLRFTSPPSKSHGTACSLPSPPAIGPASPYAKNSRRIDSEESFFIIQPSTPQNAAEKASIKTRITVNIVLNLSASIASGKSCIICGKIVNCIITPKTIHAIPTHIIARKTIRPQFFLFSSPIEEINSVEDTVKNDKKNRRIFDDMNLKIAGIFSAPGAFDISFKREGSNIMLIITYWAIDMKVENPARAMKTHASAVTKLDRLISDSKSILLSMPNGAANLRRAATRAFSQGRLAAATPMARRKTLSDHPSPPFPLQPIPAGQLRALRLSPIGGNTCALGSGHGT